MIDLQGLPSVITAMVPSRAPTATLQLYPNPAAGQVTVQTAQAGTVRLLDAVGRVVHQAAVRAGTTRLDIGPLPAGLYAARLEQGGRVMATARLQVLPQGH